MKKINYKKAIDNIRGELKGYLQKYKLQALVIGESGGIDSALCTVLAAPVCKEMDIKLIGRSITIETNKQDEIERGRNIGQNFCTDFKELDLTNTYSMFRDDIEEDIEENNFEVKLRRGNIKARIRMVYLYNLAQRNKGLVLSTDNYTEYLEGFWTLHGDVGDYGMIQNLWKTEVYELSKWIVNNELKSDAEKSALQACIEAVSTDGLGITGSDLEQLGVASYAEVDNLLQNYLIKGTNLDSPVVKRHLQSSFKRVNPYNIKRESIVNN